MKVVSQAALTIKWIFIFAFLLIAPTILYASFIESTIGTAVVNDATATFFNPASLVQLNNYQIISLNTYAQFRNHFTGETIQNGVIQSGNSNAITQYILPSVYLAVPIKNKVTLGFAVVVNSFNKDFESDSILRYAQSNSATENIDFVPAIGVKVNQYLALGAGLNFSAVRIWTNPIVGFPKLNIPDSESHNNSKGQAFGGDVGFLLTPKPFTRIGFNYRTAVTYPMSGTSILENPYTVSNQYRFKTWTPATAVLTVGQLATKALGFIATLRYIQWNIYNKVAINGIAGPLGVTNATALFRYHNSWTCTLGAQYRIFPKWVWRAAGTYVESPANGRYQISNGDGFILGASVGYIIIKNIVMDAAYAHEFVGDKSIHITSLANQIIGVNSGFRNSVALRLTINMW